MAISKMSKVMIVSHRSEIRQLLENVQKAGLMQILDAERAMVTKEWPELNVETTRHRELEDTISKLDTAIEFLKQYTDQKELPSALSPLMAIDKGKYSHVIASEEALTLLEDSLTCKSEIEETKANIEHNQTIVDSLELWSPLAANVEEIKQWSKANLMAGTLPAQNFAETLAAIEEAGGVVEIINSNKTTKACLVGCLNDNAIEISKTLRSCDFEGVSFEGMSGTISENVEKLEAELVEFGAKLSQLKQQAGEFSKSRINLQILADHYTNLHNREQTQGSAPATESTVLLEGWVQNRDFKKLENIVKGFDSSSLQVIEPGEGEEPPVEILNPRAIKPFEVITRLYGMPQHFELDPTAILAPFFLVFFGLCLADAGYGIVVTLFSIYMMRKMQGDKKLLVLICASSIATIVAGALTGGWFGDAAQQLATAFGWTWLTAAREKMIWFDPLSEPMTFFTLSLALGYIHIMVGLFAGFIHQIRSKKLVSAVFDFLVWIVMLNCITASMFGEKVGIPASLTGVLGKVALVPAACILFLSQREGGIGARLGMGAYNLFSTIFYLGDVLSYLRLMALGMVGGGLAMAINVIASTVGGSLVGKILLAPAILIGGHLFNIALSALGAFVHTLRLQFVEFFPKFMEGGGRDFTPLKEKYRYVYLQSEKA